MTDRESRERLVELIEQAEGLKNNDFPSIGELADHLLANGVIVLPAPIGLTVYEIRARGNRPTLYGSRKVDFGIMSKLYFESAIAQGLEFYVKDKSFVKYDKTRWNKTVFATKEEAENTLKHFKNTLKEREKE